MENLEMFIGALVVVYLVPGPDMVLLLQTSSTQGRGQALATAAGLALARMSHIAFAAVGLATLLKSVPIAFDAVRLLGVAYLLWLGIKIARAPLITGSVCTAQPGKAPQAYRAAVWRGLLTNITNPKALIFCSVLLPQFVHPSTGNVPSQFALLGAVLVATGTFFDLLYSVAGIALRHWIDRHPFVQTMQRWTFVALLIGFGARLAVTARPQ